MKPANLGWCAPWMIAFAGAACSPSETAPTVAIPAQPQTAVITAQPPVDASPLPPPAPLPGERPDGRPLRSMPILISQCQGLESLFAATSSGSPDRPLLILRLRSSYAELARAAERAGAAKVLQGARDASAKYDALLGHEYAAWCASPANRCAP